MTAALDAVTSLDADRILRTLLSVITATSRTNEYRLDEQGNRREFQSVKLDPHQVPGVPKPVPAHEIWVYSPRLEGVHLRFGDVARGGLRWSDRPEDFRTEILGLVKAQEVKNAVIVPVGAKGGFVVKRPPTPIGDPQVDRERQLAEGVACYRMFIAGLLDLTDNRHGGVDRAAGSGGPPGRRRFLPGRRRGQGHRDVLRHRQRCRRTTTGSGWTTPSPPAAASATTTRPWASPPAAPGNRSSTTSANSGSTPRPRISAASASATCPVTCSATACCCPSTSGCSPPSTTGTSSSTRPRTSANPSSNGCGCSSCPARRGPTTTRR